MSEIIAARQLEDPLYVVDLGVVVRLFHAWQAALPCVTPFYAVKSFTDKAVISTLAALGAGFDCASESEVSRHQIITHSIYIVSIRVWSRSFLRQ